MLIFRETAQLCIKLNPRFFLLKYYKPAFNHKIKEKLNYIVGKV